MAKKISLNEKHQELFNEVQKEVKRANQRLVRIERETGKNSWAGKRLESKLDSYINAWTDSGRVKINKSMSMTKLHAIQKATRQFLESQTSTVGGIKKTIKRQKEGLKQSLSRDYEDDVDSLSDDEVETLYNIFSDEYAQDIIQFIGGSTLQGAIYDSKIMKLSQKNFIEYMKENFLEFSNDSDMKDKVIHIYNKFVK